MYDLGDTVPLGVTVLDDDAELVDATTVTVTIGLPDGTTDTTQTPTNPTTGNYRLDYVPTQAGRHTVRWVSTGPATAFTDSFDVRGTLRTIVSLVDVKAHLGMSAGVTTDDEELRSHVETATEIIEDITGDVLVRRSVEDIVEATGRPFRLWATPVLSLTTVERLDGTQTWDVDNLHVTSDSGIVRTLSGSSVSGLVRVTYVVGAAQIPARLALAAKELVRASWESQRGKTAASRFVNRADDGQVLMGGRYLPPEVAELIGPSQVWVA